MNRIKLYTVAPAIPEELRFLETLSHNMWWCWRPDAIELFRRIDPQLWKDCGRNPLVFLRHVRPELLAQQAEEPGFVAHVARVKQVFEEEVSSASADRFDDGCIAYFSLEYGLHESFRNYSGGLGVLAGDHLKAASDFGMPLVAVGLLYRLGFFRQYLNEDGWQQEAYPENELHHLPITPITDDAGERVMVKLPLPSGRLHAALWRLDVGRVPLILLDANVQENPPEFRKITAQLYGGDAMNRIRQELLLGVGGYRALRALGYRPRCCHINEGHAAFLSLARLEHLVKSEGLELEAALEVVRRTNVFTTHTPVPAGNETFSVDLVRPHLEALEPETGVPTGRVIAWGQPHDGSVRHEISMTILGLRLAQQSNGVSELHGRVARQMWSHLWSSYAEDETPILHVTNGVHVPSWLSPDNAVLYDRYLGPHWQAHPAAGDFRGRVDRIPDEELWRAHELGRSRLVRAAREQLEQQFAQRNATRTEIHHARAALDHDVLTIGFARRFATYKRGTLLLRDRDRLKRLLLDPERPVQILFSGRAHPADHSGKELIREIVHFAREADVGHRLIFLENYDINVARYMVQGVDVWLNTPRRPHEASGTSGMKACINGGIHCSVLDGWWAEGYAPDCGWAIGDETTYADTEYQDDVESHALYNLLEDEIVPMFYDRTAGDVPRGWVAMMKQSVMMSLSFFTSHRMVAEYRTLFYQPALERHAELMKDDAALARTYVTERDRYNAAWSGVRIELPCADRDLSTLHMGDAFTVSTRVHLGDLAPDDVDVEVYSGPVDSHGNVVESRTEGMDLAEDHGGGVYTYRRTVNCRRSGRYGFTTRVRARGEHWRRVMPGWATWAQEPNAG